MAQAKTIKELQDEANVIYNETETGANTAHRVGNMCLDLIEKDAAQDEKDGEQDDRLTNIENTLDELGGSAGVLGHWKMYFLNIDGGILPDTPDKDEDYIANGDKFKVKFSGTERSNTFWINSNDNPTGNQDTYAIWVWMVGDSSPQYIDGPIKIYDHASGFSNGADGEELEWIYYRSTVTIEQAAIDDDLRVSLARCCTSVDNPITPSNAASWAEPDARPAGWRDNPQGVDPINKYEYAAFRRSSNASNGERKWGDTPFIGPYLWSAYGKQGLDGDGVEYIFYAANNNPPLDNADHTAVNWPPNWNPGDTGSFPRIQDPEYTGPSGSAWMDNPIDLETSSLGPGAKQWVSIRKKRKWIIADGAYSPGNYTAASDSSEDIDATWGPFSEPALWSYYAKDGVADGYSVDLKPDTMLVNAPGGKVSNYLSMSYIQVYHNGVSLTTPSLSLEDTNDPEGTWWTNDSNITSQKFKFRVSSITDETNTSISSVLANNRYNDGDAGVAIYPVHTGNKIGNYIGVSISGLKNFGGKQIRAIVEVKYNTGDSIENVTTVLVINFIESDKPISLYTSADVISVDYYGNNCAPKNLYVGVRIGNELYSQGVSGSAGTALSQNYKFKYYYTYLTGSGANTTEQQTTTAAVANETIRLSSRVDDHYFTWLTVIMLKSNTEEVVAFENIPFVRDGAPGIGHSAWNISVLSTTVTKSTDATPKVSGTIKFKITGPKKDSTTGELENKGSNEITSGGGINSNDQIENLYVKLNGNNIYPSYSDNIWTAIISDVTYNQDYPYSTITVTSDNNTTLASATIPIIMPGKDGDGAVQALPAVIIRFKNFNALSGGDLVYNGFTPDGSGLYYKDIIYREGDNNYYYITPNLPASLPENVSIGGYSEIGQAICTGDFIHDNFDELSRAGIIIVIQAMSDGAFQTLLAKYAFVENFTAREIVVTGSDGSPLAGITQSEATYYTKDAQGNTVPIESGSNDYVTRVMSEIYRGSVRIWAGLPNGSSDLTDCAFYVTETGHVKATLGSIGGFEIGTNSLGTKLGAKGAYLSNSSSEPEFYAYNSTSSNSATLDPDRVNVSGMSDNSTYGVTITKDGINISSISINGHLFNDKIIKFGGVFTSNDAIAKIGNSPTYIAAYVDVFLDVTNGDTTYNLLRLNNYEGHQVLIKKIGTGKTTIKDSNNTLAILSKETVSVASEDNSYITIQRYPSEKIFVLHNNTWY